MGDVGLPTEEDNVWATIDLWHIASNKREAGLLKTRLGH